MSRMNRRDFLRRGAALGGGIGAVAALGIDRVVPVLAASDASALRDLSRRLHGRLLLPDDPGYDVASAPANGRYRSIRPMAVAQCADATDVSTCVKWAASTGIPLVGRGGGHSYAGYSTTRGLLVDLGRLSTVTVDRAAGIATVGGAAHNQDVYDALHDGPLFLPGGTCLGVGVGGLVLGGGIGYNTHWAGLTCDHLTGTDIVVASGERLRADATSEPDLYWACRGGAGGSFGLNTSFTFQLVEVPASDVAWYRFTWRGADAAEAVLSAFDTMMQDAPAGLNAVAMAQAAPVGTDGPREAIDVMSRGQYIGSTAELADLVAPLRAAAPPTTEVLQPMAFWDVIRTISTPQPPSHSFGDISRYADRPVPGSVYSEVVDLLADCPSRSKEASGSFWSLGWVGGEVVDRVGRTDTAYVHRGMTTLLRPTPEWPDDAPPSVGRNLTEWTDAVVATLDGHTPKESYQNFPNRRIRDWKRQYYAENYERLVSVKTTYDPDNLFRNAQSIPPAA